MKDLSIIIVSYNTKELLRECLDSIVEDLRRSTISAEIIVVDNGSKDGTVAALQQQNFQLSTFNFQLIQNKSNLGFAKANNQAAKIAQGRHLLFLNSDTIIGSTSLQTMVECMDQHPHTGIASCQLTNPDGSIQPQGGSLPRLSTVAIWSFFLDDIPILHEMLPSYQMQRKNFFTGAPKRVGWVGGTAMWVKRDVWEKLGGFDEQLFMYGEDVELCYKAHQAGIDVMLNPGVSIIHRGRGSSQKARWITGEARGLLELFRKHKPAWEMPILKLILAIGMGLRWLIFGILKQDEHLKRAYARAFRMAR